MSGELRFWKWYAFDEGKDLCDAGVVVGETRAIALRNARLCCGGPKLALIDEVHVSLVAVGREPTEVERREYGGTIRTTGLRRLWGRA